jgi:hypothetical protein
LGSWEVEGRAYHPTRDALVSSLKANGIAPSVAEGWWNSVRWEIGGALFEASTHEDGTVDVSIHGLTAQAAANLAPSRAFVVEAFSEVDESGWIAGAFLSEEDAKDRVEDLRRKDDDEWGWLNAVVSEVRIR